MDQTMAERALLVDHKVDLYQWIKDRNQLQEWDKTEEASTEIKIVHTAEVRMDTVLRVMECPDKAHREEAADMQIHPEVMEVMAEVVNRQAMGGARMEAQERWTLTKVMDMEAKATEVAEDILAQDHNLLIFHVIFNEIKSGVNREYQISLKSVLDQSNNARSCP